MRHTHMESAGRSRPAARETCRSAGAAGENETGKEKIFHLVLLSEFGPL